MLMLAGVMPWQGTHTKSNSSRLPQHFFTRSSGQTASTATAYSLQRLATLVRIC